METVDCVWNEIFDEDEKNSLHEGLFLTGIVSVILGLWFNSSILLTNKLSLDRSYRNLANFTTAACIRGILSLLTHFLTFSSKESDPTSCQFFAFLETFLAVFEVEWLTHVCIERYVVAKYMKNGWPIQKQHYTLFQCLCLFFASLYSFPPLIGVGRYDYDFSCSFCTFDMMLPGSSLKYVVAMIFVLRSVKPAVFMLLMLIWARSFERKLPSSEEAQKQGRFTKNIIIVTFVNQFCWSSLALIRGSVIFSQLLYSYPIVPTTAFYIKWAMWMNWVAPGLTVLVLFIVDHRIRKGMLHFQSTEDAENLEDKKET